MDAIAGPTYTFNGVDGLFDTADRLPDAERQDVYVHHEERDEWEEVNWRDSLWMDDFGAVGDVSSSQDFYNVIQYGDVLEAVGHAVNSHGDIDVSGNISLSSSGHKMTGHVQFDGATIEPAAGDRIDLGLQIRSGHSGYHGVKYDVGAKRQVCANGMVAFIDEMSFDQTHHQPLNPALAQQAVDAVVDGTDEVEDRMQRAQDRTFQDVDEAVLVLYDFGLDRYFPEPREVFHEAMEVEMDGDQPTLYDTYNAATRALTHYVEDDMPEYVRADALEEAGQLLDYPGYGLPDADYLGKRAVDNRIEERVEAGEELQPVIAEDEAVERERLTELRAAYNEE